MSTFNLKKQSKAATPLHLISEAKFKISNYSKDHQAWMKAQGFEGKSGQLVQLPCPKKGIDQIILVIEGHEKTKQAYEFMWALGALPQSLPNGDYALHTDLSKDIVERFVLGWALGAYQFSNFKTKKAYGAHLVIPKNCDGKKIEDMASSIYLTRDLINRPANDLMPSSLWAKAQHVAKAYKAKTKTIAGKDLLKENFPAIYEVGKASDDPPRLIELSWGKAKDPHIILVGKGVTFDTGGLDIKPSSNMRLMKKDMGGAAHVLGLANLIMAQKLPVRLTMLIPSVENAISGNAYRPSDIIKTRKGLTVEVGNTDAEGRLVLADALTYADEMKPDLIIDMATLTGAARIALGLDLPVMFANNEKLAAGLEKAAEKVKDPIWRLPLWEGYRKDIESNIADLCNISNSVYGGAITAALFLERFIETEKRSWAHFDLMAYNTKSRPGRPEGGEAMAFRAVYELIEAYCTKG
jgi:leucyl aminopeptidase